MSMIRFLLADRFGFSWEGIKKTPCHIIQQYILDVEKSKRHFKGVGLQDARKFAESAALAGIPLT